MGNISWTKSWSSSDDGTILYGADLQNIQADVTAVVNGNITNANVNASAAVVESKIAFHLTTGHSHDGVDSRSIATPAKHYRRGLLLYGDDDENICVRPGSLDIDGTIISRTTASGDIAIATNDNWITGAVGTVVSAMIYVYAYNNSGAIGYKLSNTVPNLSDADDNTTEIPYRYYTFNSVYYRCLGGVYVDAAGDLCWGQASSEGLYVTQFDASNQCIINGLGTGSDQTIITLWTPKWVKIFRSSDATPATGEAAVGYEAPKEMLNASWYGTALNFEHGVDHLIKAVTSAGSINAITAQTVSVAGSFTIDAITDDYYWYAIAYTDEV